jgi:hypothetical protein
MQNLFYPGAQSQELCVKLELNCQLLLVPPLVQLTLSFDPLPFRHLALAFCKPPFEFSTFVERGLAILVCLSGKVTSDFSANFLV